MSDKVQLIKEEIESYKESMKGLEPHSDFRRGQITAYNQIMQFIDSLPEEPVSEGIENELERFAYSLPHSADGFWPKDIDHKSVEARTKYGVRHAWSYEKVMDIARHFAEWQKRQMMEDAVDAIIFSELKGSDGSLFQAKSDRFRMNGVKISDKIKIIPIKN